MALEAPIMTGLKMFLLHTAPLGGIWTNAPIEGTAMYFFYFIIKCYDFISYIDKAFIKIHEEQRI